MMEQVYSTIIRFTKEQDIRQTADLLQQRVDESIQEPERHRDFAFMEPASEGREALYYGRDNEC